MHWNLEIASRVAAACAQQAGVGLLHGDALRGNAVSATDGLTLIDFDSVCRGPRQWDLVPSWISVQRLGRDTASWHAFLQGYGIEAERLGSLDANRFGLRRVCSQRVP